MEQELKQNRLQLERESDETKKWRMRSHAAESSLENATLASSSKPAADVRLCI
jgi:hypothetical protein